MDENSLLMDIGVLLIFAFVGATLATKGKQSVILGYIVAGIVIGPFIHFSLFGITYNGLIQDQDIISAFSQIGLVLLIFFVGLEFSFDKIKRVKGPAVILSLIDVGVNMFTGIVLATALGWPLVDTIFLSAILSMSCSAVAMKTLMELGRLGNPETEYMLGMIIMEEFISMIFLTVVGGLIVRTSGSSSLVGMAIGMAMFFVFFIIMAVAVIPTTVTKLQKMESDELFVLFMLGVILLVGRVRRSVWGPTIDRGIFHRHDLRRDEGDGPNGKDDRPVKGCVRGHFLCIVADADRPVDVRGGHRNRDRGDRPHRDR